MLISQKREILKTMTNVKCQISNVKWSCLLLITLCLLPGFLPSTQAQSTQSAPDFQTIIARQASLVSEFEVNGLKVLVKRREGSQTVAAGLFIRGGVGNINANNAGIEALML